MRRVAGFALALACTSATACFHSSQAWPVPLHPGSFVTAKFAEPRSIMIGDDSALVVTELSGRVVSWHGDTLVVHLGTLAGQSRKAWTGRDATFTLDSATTVVHTEFNKGSIPLVVIAGMVSFYAFLGALPP